MELTKLLKELNEATLEAGRARATVDEAMTAEAEARRTYAAAVQKAQERHRECVKVVRDLNLQVQELINGTIGAPAQDDGRVRG